MIVSCCFLLLYHEVTIFQAYPRKQSAQRMQGYLALSNEQVGLDRISEGSVLKRPRQYVKTIASAIERFSFERRKVIGFAITMPHDWLKKLAPHFHPIRSKTKTNRNSLARVFPRFASATCNYYEF